MAIVATCEHCSAKLLFKDVMADKPAKCRACDKPIVVRGPAIPDYDVFVSHSSQDKATADAVCAALEARQIRCWIAPRDILAGTLWAGAILDAIAEVRLMVVIYSSASNESKQVVRELDQAVKRNIAIVPFRIEDAPMCSELEYYLSTAHWLDAFDGPLDPHLHKLVQTTVRLLRGKSTRPSTPHAPGGGRSPEYARTGSGLWLWSVALLGLLAVGGLGVKWADDAGLIDVRGLIPKPPPIVAEQPVERPPEKPNGVAARPPALPPKPAPTPVANAVSAPVASSSAPPKPSPTLIATPPAPTPINELKPDAQPVAKVDEPIRPVTPPSAPPEQKFFRLADSLVERPADADVAPGGYFTGFRTPTPTDDATRLWGSRSPAPTPGGTYNSILGNTKTR